MPELDGLQVVETVGADAMPLTVFATAYDHYAIRAFEPNALDYLLAPFSDERFEGRTRLIPVGEIDWIESAGVYVNLHIGGAEVLYRSALNELADHLDSMRFAQVHRTAIVNIDSIVELQPISHGEFHVLLRDGHCSRISRTYRVRPEKRLGQSL